MLFFKKTNSLAQIIFHDIKNKLASIKLSINILEKDNIPSSKKREVIKNIKRNINSVIEMLKEFIELEKYQSSKLKNEKFELSALIKEILEELHINLTKKEIEVIFSPKEHYIIANKEWLKKALFNIIHNAIKYNKPNGMLFIKIEKEKQGYLIIIKDSGIGLSKEEIKKIFTKFYTTDKKEGSGIGLLLSKKVIENLGGSIAIKSKKNKGSEFYIYLPKTAKSIKIKRLLATFSTILIILFFSIDFFYGLFPQKIIKQKEGDLIVYKLENNTIIKTDKHSIIKIEAYKNLIGSNFRTDIKIIKADAYFITNNNPLTVSTENIKIKNMGTEFEVIKEKAIATSVYKGKIKANNEKIAKNEGFYTQGGKIIIAPLPLKVDNITIKNEELEWRSNYKEFKITIAKNSEFTKGPIFVYKTSLKKLELNLADGIWYIGIQSINNNLLSPISSIKYLSLFYYKKALKAFKSNNISLANTFLDKSLETINKASYKPYLLKSKIVNNPKTSLYYANLAYEIEQNRQTGINLAEVLFKNRMFKKSLSLALKYKDNFLIAKNYFYLKEYKKAKKFLYAVLEENPNNIEALKMLIDILKKEKSPSVEILQEHLKELNDSI